MPVAPIKTRAAVAQMDFFGQSGMLLLSVISHNISVVILCIQTYILIDKNAGNTEINRNSDWNNGYCGLFLCPNRRFSHKFNRPVCNFCYESTVMLHKEQGWAVGKQQRLQLHS